MWKTNYRTVVQPVTEAQLIELILLQILPYLIPWLVAYLSDVGLENARPSNISMYLASLIVGREDRHFLPVRWRPLPRRSPEVTLLLASLQGFASRPQILLGNARGGIRSATISFTCTILVLAVPVLAFPVPAAVVL